MKIVVLGTGFVAQGYLRMLHYLGFHPLVLSRAWLNYTDEKELSFLLRSYGPKVVINCAGYTGETVDDCSAWPNRTECYHSHVTLAHTIATLCDLYGIPVLHVSSGCIFNGVYDGLVGFTEEDRPNFLTGWYQHCKHEAEKILDNAWIFRIRMPFSQYPHPRNWLCKLMKYEKILNGLNSVTWLDEFCMRSWMVWQKAPRGIYHCVQPGPVWTADVARKLKLHDPELYDPKEFLTKHVARSEAVLSGDKFEKAFGAAGTDAMSAIDWCIEGLTAQAVVEHRVA